MLKFSSLPGAVLALGLSAAVSHAMGIPPTSVVLYPEGGGAFVNWLFPYGGYVGGDYVQLR
jgi:hypothetical protein